METTYTYEIIEDNHNRQMIRRSDGACIPSDVRNSDYQAYLKSLENADEL